MKTWRNEKLLVLNDESWAAVDLYYRACPFNKPKSIPFLSLRMEGMDWFGCWRALAPSPLIKRKLVFFYGGGSQSINQLSFHSSNTKRNKFLFVGRCSWRSLIDCGAVLPPSINSLRFRHKSFHSINSLNFFSWRWKKRNGELLISFHFYFQYLKLYTFDLDNIIIPSTC